MHVLVTGGTGFVGLALAERLLALGHRVRLLAPVAPTQLLRDPALFEAELHIGDIRDANALSTALEGVGAVAHLAAITPDAGYEIAEPARVVDVNVGGTATLIRAVALHAPKARVLAVSSVAVYGTGDPKGESWDELRDPPAPVSLYGITKFAAEQVAARLARINEIDLVIARLGPVFGPWEHDSGVRPLLSPQAQVLALALSGQEIILPRAMAADWLYSRDAGNALAALLLTEHPRHALFNVGAGRILRVSDWCEAAAAHLPDLRWRLAHGADAANVHITLDRDRAALAVNRLCAILPGPPSRTLSACVEDQLAWAQTLPQIISLSRREQ